LGRSSISQILQIVLQGPAVVHNTAWNRATKLTGLRDGRYRRSQQRRDEDGLEYSSVVLPFGIWETLSTANRVVCVKMEVSWSPVRPDHKTPVHP
jgi:hypothetical protein